MNELYSQSYSSSIIESYNNTEKNGVSLIKIAQKIPKLPGIFNYAYGIFKRVWMLTFADIRHTANKYAPRCGKQELFLT